MKQKGAYFRHVPAAFISATAIYLLPSFVLFAGPTLAGVTHMMRGFLRRSLLLEGSDGWGFIYKSDQGESNRLSLPKPMFFSPTAWDFFIPFDDTMDDGGDDDTYDDSLGYQEMPEYQTWGGQFGGGSSSAVAGPSSRDGDNRCSHKCSASPYARMRCTISSQFYFSKQDHMRVTLGDVSTVRELKFSMDDGRREEFYQGGGANHPCFPPPQ